jgi:hypothetical protein
MHNKESSLSSMEMEKEKPTPFSLTPYKSRYRRYPELPLRSP